MQNHLIFRPRIFFFFGKKSAKPKNQDGSRGKIEATANGERTKRRAGTPVLRFAHSPFDRVSLRQNMRHREQLAVDSLGFSDGFLKGGVVYVVVADAHHHAALTL